MAEINGNGLGRTCEIGYGYELARGYGSTHQVPESPGEGGHLYVGCERLRNKLSEIAMKGPGGF